jgi:hypothetical protein
MQPAQVTSGLISETQVQLRSGFRSRARLLLDSTTSFSAFIASILIAKALWTCRDRIADPDLWWHLRNAKFTIENHRPPVFDTYTFTVANAPWLDHSWLSELIFYGSFHFGLTGIFVLFALCVAALSVGMLAMCLQETDDPLAAGTVTIFCGLLAMSAYTPRPQLFGWICFLGIYAILLRFRKLGHAPLWAIPILFCLWINSHPGWPFGIAVFLIIGTSGFLSHDFGPIAVVPWSKREQRQLIVTFLCSCLALLVNPYGYKLLYYPFDLAMREKLTVGLVEEWGSVNFDDQRGIYVFILLAALFLMAVWASRRWRIDEIVLTIFVLYGGLAHIRFLLPAALVLAPILAPRLGRISSHVAGHERRVLNAVCISIVVGFMIWAFPSRETLRAHIRGYFPERAVDYLKSHPVQGNLFNWYEWGGYLEWNLPGVPVFIDGRTDFFEGHAVLADYLRIAGLADSDVLLRDYKIRFVLIPSNTPLSYVLSTSPHWKATYDDDQSVIYQNTDQ